MQKLREHWVKLAMSTLLTSVLAVMGYLLVLDRERIQAQDDHCLAIAEMAGEKAVDACVRVGRLEATQPGIDKKLDKLDKDMGQVIRLLYTLKGAQKGVRHDRGEWADQRGD